MIGARVLKQQIQHRLGRTYGVWCGRGTTALWLALRAIWRRDGPGEVILPDLVCESVLHGVLLAGFIPVFADVLPARYTLSAESVARLRTPHTRAILVAHLFGQVADLDSIRQAAPGIPIIEDAVQGIGGTYRDQPVGAWGDLAFLSFDRHKMLGGRGGLLLFDDPALLVGIETDAARLDNGLEVDLLPLDSLAQILSPAAAAAYAHQLRTVFAPALLRALDEAPANLERMRADWRSLNARVNIRNENARQLQALLADLPLTRPDLRPGDAIWCYTLAAPSAALARRVLRRLYETGSPGSDLYYPLSQLIGQPGGAGYLKHRLINLWADEHTPLNALPAMADTIRAALALVSQQRVVTD
jgi:dTDP-4-amino-4,6-dideoxygalactose transaminase